MAQARRASSLIRVVLALALGVLSACDLPRDPEGTLDRVSGDVMRIGITNNDPWTRYSGGEASGVEVRIFERFAEELDARIEWIPGSEEDLLTALEVREVDAVVGGLTSTNPWSAKVTLTHPYMTTSAVVAVPSGDEIPDDIAGLDVSVERGSEMAGILEKTDANVVYVEEIAEADGPAALDNWLLDELGLEDTGVTLVETDHVIAMPLGENAWLVRLERYLLENEEEIQGILEEEGKP